MGRIGEALRKAREEKGITLRQAEEATKIRLKYLDALEREEFTQLPGRVYAIGFLRNYARYLGLNWQELVDELKAQWPPEEEIKPTPSSTIQEKRPKKGFLTRWLGILLVLVLLWAVNQGYNRYRLTLGSSTSFPPVEEKPSQVVSPPPSPAPPPPSLPKVSGVEVKIYIKEKQCWISVKVDGREVFAGILKGGESRTFRGEREITLTLGNAGVAEVTVNNEILPPLGKVGEVVTRTFTTSGATSEKVDNTGRVSSTR
ncbi:protein RodZ, contains Xre-like HTH and DUF4115 domains [Thermanaeromonas toyohensis ToBE]|uniref:Protein RodZ, contains Xre-like HTH and DUF4115 domains n=1 Tax=Thermanaeromonas toyohensis ToBE TaxID=698762 RepID=A0A1W1VUY1_9FIRM|nr:helix-turn-helix domain-containing protein [Thermanaeromonas toyohensis]SMB97169.1 protein RodZ, contains Xre-like HTH and DUF4115 domains [Thermanaeromonas toyohensis ToBE]